MKNKVLITVILSLFMIIFVPNIVSAESYYVCYPYTERTDIGITGVKYKYSKVEYMYSNEIYSEYRKTYYEPGDNYENGKKVPQQLVSYFVIYNKTKKSWFDGKTRCEDVYAGVPKFNYDTYKSYVDLGIISADNKFDMEVYKITKAYLNVPREDATASEIINYIDSTLIYGDWKSLTSERLLESKIDSWKKTLGTNNSDYRELLNNGKKKSWYFFIKTADKILEKAELKKFIGTNQSANIYDNKQKYAYKTAPDGNASVEYIYLYMNSDAEHNNGEGVKKVSKVIQKKWADTLKDAYQIPMDGAILRDMYKDKSDLLYEYASEEESDPELVKKLEENIKKQAEKTSSANRETYENTLNNGNSNNNTGTVTDRNTSITNNYKECKDDWWKCAWSFLNKGENSEHQFGDSVSGSISEIRSMIFDIGNVIFILVTAFLGVKYIWGGVDSKFSVKNSLVTLVVAAIVFYGWNALADVLDIKDLLTGETSQSGVKGFVGVVYNTVMYIINFAAVGGIIYIGIKYMMAGADGKAEMKLKGIPVVMGIIMVYGTVNLINFILKIIDGL